MKRASGIGHLKPFLPGLEAVLEDPEVSELMINGPGNVWVERGGELEPIETPALTAAALHRAAIHIARPLGLDPATRPILDARLDDGSRVAICTPPASPHVAMTIRRFGGRAFSADDLVRQGALPEKVFLVARDTLTSRRNILVSGGTGSGKTTLLIVTAVRGGNATITACGRSRHGHWARTEPPRGPRQGASPSARRTRRPASRPDAHSMPPHRLDGRRHLAVRQTPAYSCAPSTGPIRPAYVFSTAHLDTRVSPCLT